MCLYVYVIKIQLICLIFPQKDISTGVKVRDGKETKKVNAGDEKFITVGFNVCTYC